MRRLRFFILFSPQCQIAAGAWYPDLPTLRNLKEARDLYPRSLTEFIIKSWYLAFGLSRRDYFDRKILRNFFAGGFVFSRQR